MVSKGGKKTAEKIIEMMLENPSCMDSSLIWYNVSYYRS